MKTIFIISILLISNLSAQQYYTFSELEGMENNEGETNLFYRLYSYEYFSSYDFDIRNDIYLLNTIIGLDTFYLADYYHQYNINWVDRFITHNFDLFDNDPHKYIYCYSSGFSSNLPKVTSPSTVIQRYDDFTFGYLNISLYADVGISKQNDSLVYGSNGNFVKSTDGGFNWVELPLENFIFISVSPFNDNIVFGQEFDGGLLKSIDGGQTSVLVDTNSARHEINYYKGNQFLFDSDSIHIYRVFINPNGNFFSVSDNNGDSFSWTIKHSSLNRLFLTIDYSQSGSIYLADGRYIYNSTDYGSTFNEYRVLDRKIVGIYKKPNSDKLYAATKYDLYEITADTILTIKHLAVDPDLFTWYPLEVGNKWIYNYWYEIDTTFETGISVQEITGDTTINGKHYFIFNNSNNFIRQDSLTGKIYKGTFSNNNIYENLYADLTLDVGDTLNDSTNYQWLTVLDEQQFNQWGLNTKQKFFNDFSTSITHTFSFIKEIGLYDEFIYELGGGGIELKGAIIDGIIYGDTTTVGVNDPENTIQEFSLSQNYPNPFNPTTKIKFVIPKSSLVNLKVFDILGRELATLVNEEKQAGEYEVEFKPVSGNRNLASGIYFYQLKAGDPESISGQGFIETKKMILMK